MATRATVEKIEARGLTTCDTYGQLIRQTRMSGAEVAADEYRHKLRGYLTALVDLGVLTRMELQEAYLWYATVKLYDQEQPDPPPIEG